MLARVQADVPALPGVSTNSADGIIGGRAGCKAGTPNRSKRRYRVEDITPRNLPDVLQLSRKPPSKPAAFLYSPRFKERRGWTLVAPFAKSRALGKSATAFRAHGSVGRAADS